MTVLEMTGVVVSGSLAAGFVGALTGLGGGVVIVPFLTLGLGVDIRYAIGASLVSVIATSSGAAAAYVREGYTNMRIGMFLEVATTLGAIAGAQVATRAPTSAIAVLFGCVLLYSALPARHLREEGLAPEESSALARRLRLPASEPTLEGMRAYGVRGVPAGLAVMGVAGLLSGLLGVGSGAVKVLALDRAMRLPFKVSATTSNFMIGVTAAASAGVYLARGYVDPGLAMPVVLGVLAGSLLGARVLVHAPIGPLRRLFTVVLIALAAEMLWHGARGTL